MYLVALAEITASAIFIFYTFILLAFCFYNYCCNVITDIKIILMKILLLKKNHCNKKVKSRLQILTKRQFVKYFTHNVELY